MSTVVVSHMLAGSGADIWYPALRAEFTAAGHHVVIPDLPDPQAPDADAWLKAITAVTDPAQAPDTVLVGHSLGSVNLLRLLARHDTERFGPYAGLVLVAGMAKEVGYEPLAPFFAPAFDWARIRSAAPAVRVLHAADDPVTGAATPEHLMSFARDLGATVTLLPTGGHFPTTGTPLTELPQASRLVRELLPATAAAPTTGVADGGAL
ncbi:RBBP9/YdeN family alpha/beta hydrolase [Kitasatospora sp. McL0602]|uniref:RBBP9/YdeN family alpha/beta hydrolase n=1 Tax=Kitasatospora sp. McL0602 TaxID=3439530 RepID=UPI003F8BD3BB